jgi:nucleoid DNA-binding protein
VITVGHDDEDVWDDEGVYDHDEVCNFDHHPSLKLGPRDGHGRTFPSGAIRAFALLVAGLRASFAGDCQRPAPTSTRQRRPRTFGSSSAKTAPTCAFLAPFPLASAKRAHFSAFFRRMRAAISCRVRPQSLAWQHRTLDGGLSRQTAACSVHKPRGVKMAKGPLSKSALIQTIADKSDGKLTRKDVKGVLEAVATIGQTELKKNGLFVVPGLVRMVVIKKPATKERKGINPFTKEETIFKAKPARKVVKARAVKAAKDAVA